MMSRDKIQQKAKKKAKNFKLFSKSAPFLSIFSKIMSPFWLGTAIKQRHR